VGEPGPVTTATRLGSATATSARDVLKLSDAESWNRGMELFRVIQGRGRYYLVIAWSEISKVKVPYSKKGMATIPVKSVEGGDHTLLVDRESAAWTERTWKAFGRERTIPSRQP